MKIYKWIAISALLSPISLLAQNKTTLSINGGYQSHFQNTQIHQTYFLQTNDWESDDHTTISDESFATSKAVQMSMQWNIGRFEYGFRNQFSYQSFYSNYASTGEIVSQTSTIKFSSYALDQGLILGYQFFGGKEVLASKGISITPRANLGVSRRQSKIHQKVNQGSHLSQTQYSHGIATLYAGVELEIAYHFNEKLQFQFAPGIQQTDFSFEAFGVNDTPSSFDILPSFKGEYQPRPNYSAVYINAGISLSF